MQQQTDIQRRGLSTRKLAVTLYFCQVLTTVGCAALVAPIHGIDANKLDHSFSMPTRSGQKTIDLSALRQVPPPEHLVDYGDVLGVFIDGILGKSDDVPPIYQPLSDDLQPSVGYPVTVHANGTLSLPFIDPVSVRGLTIEQVQQVVTNAYVNGPRPMLQPNQARIMVTLQRPRTYRVLVIRQESDNRQGNLGASEAMNFEQEKQGTGRVVQLPAYQNDVLHALAHTGGLPGLDAQNMIYVIRKSRNAPQFKNMWQPANSGSELTPAHAVWMQSSSRGSNLPGNPLRDPEGPPVGNASTDSGTGPVFFAQSPDGAPLVRSGASPRSAMRPVSNGRYLPGHPETSAAGDGYTRASPIKTGYSGTAGHSFLSGSTLSNQLSSPPSNLCSSSIGSFPATSMSDGLPLQKMHGISQTVQASLLVANMEGAFPGETQVICIPVRSFPGEPLPFCPDDVVLYDGDVVFIESRETEFFFTGGLLGGGQYTLPRDYDITILDAVAIAEARSGQVQGTPRSVGGASVLNQDVSVGASRAVISRPMPAGGHLKIEVNLSQAMNDAHQQIIIQPGDRIYLRYTRPEAVFAFFERFLLEGTVWGYTNNAFRNN